MKRTIIHHLRKFGVTYAIAALLLAGQANAYAIEPTALEPTALKPLAIEPTAIEPTEIKAK